MVLEGIDLGVLGEALQEVPGRLDPLDGDDLSLDLSIGGVNDDLFSVDEVPHYSEFLAL